MTLLRTILKLDAVVTGANGVAYLALAGPLADLLGLPSSFLRVIGAFLAVFAAYVWIVATRDAVTAGPVLAIVTRDAVTAGPVLAIVTANTLWVIDSLVMLALGWFDPTTAGAVWIGLQAATVGLFAGLQFVGRRAVT